MKEANGKSLSEYLLILVLVGVVAIPSVMFLGDTLQGETRNVSTAHNKGMNQLLKLLDAKPVEASGSSGSGINLYGSGQVIPTLAFNYNATTGLVEMINTADGTETTSGEGTTILTQDLQTLLDENPGALSPTQESLLNQLIQNGLAIANEEERLLSSYPDLATDSPPDLCFFNCTPNLIDNSKLYSDFLDYSTTYNLLIQSMDGSSALNSEIQDVIETNSTLISQLASENFIDSQMKMNIALNQYAPTQELDANKVKAKNIDITQITIDETPDATNQASNGIKKKKSGG